jgi:hypothetical protein
MFLVITLSAIIIADILRRLVARFSCFSFFSYYWLPLATCLATAPWIPWRRPLRCPAAACKAEVGWAA